jgi:Mlc titration factor MtfA (ptsG expression regulator)
VSEEQRVIIAAQACFLLLNRENASCFGEILGVTLSEGIVPQKAMEVATPTRPSLLWDAKRRTVLDPQDRGPGTVPAILRKLGVEPAGAPGDPDLRLTPWGRVLAGELHDHLGFAASGAWMERYGASGDPADFYAAATEAFFMHPQVLQKTDRGLYDSLRQFYKVDPVRWKVLTH